jgi:hypothetical protein
MRALLLGCLWAAGAQAANPTWIDQYDAEGASDGAAALVALGDSVFVAGHTTRRGREGWVRTGTLTRQAKVNGKRVWTQELLPASVRLAGVSCTSVAAITTSRADPTIAVACGSKAQGYFVQVVGLDGTPRWTAELGTSHKGERTLGGMVVWGDRVVVAGTWYDAGQARIVVHAFDSVGTPLWSTGHSEPKGSASATAIASDGQGGVVVVGSRSGTSWQEPLAVRVDAGGVLRWAVPISNPVGPGYATDVVVQGTGVFVAGVTSAGNHTHALLTRIGIDGTPTWRREYDSGAGDDRYVALAAGGSRVYAVGSSGSGPRPQALLQAYDDAGNVLPMRREPIAPLTTERYGDVSVDAGGQVHATGERIADNGTAVLLYDRFDASAALLQSETYSGKARGVIRGAAVHGEADGSAFIAGSQSVDPVNPDALTLRYDRAQDTVRPR